MATPTGLRPDQGDFARIATGPAQSWPGITLTASNGHWDLSPYAQVARPVQNAGTNRVTVHCRLDNPGADGIGNCLTGTVTLAPRACALKGHYAGRSPTCFSFAGANLFRKYGPDWKQRYPQVIHLRLRSWGLNTIANWSDEGVLRHPQFVGCHWFQWQDEPTTGRVYDEENHQIGFVDIADTPYRETTEASRAVAREMYRLRAAE